MEHQAEKVVYIQKKDALIIVDVQTDFISGGALVVSERHSVIGPLNHTIDLFFKKGLPVFFTRNWHQSDHCSFQEHGGPWPPHCIQDTKGAGFASNLNVPEVSIIISKAIVNETDEYTGFKRSDKMGRRRN